MVIAASVKHATLTDFVSLNVKTAKGASMMNVYLAVLARSGMVLSAFPNATKTVATSAKMENVFTNAVTAKNA